MKNVLTMLFASIAGNIFAATVDINTGWQFRQARLNNWHEAEVPGTVHTDLMRCGLIADPFMALNERGVQWVDKEDWVYETHFALNAEQMRDVNKRLVFEGLDTYADVMLNDSLILRADNMFRQWSVDVSALIRKGDNKLTVYLHSPIKTDMPKWEADKARYPAINDQSENGGIFDRQLSVFARKAGYHYGWDWGPRLVTSGIWRPVKIVTWTGIHIEETYFRQNTNARVSHIKEVVTINSDKAQKAVVLVATEGTECCRKEVMLHEGLNEVTVNFDVKKPQLWWTNGLGRPHLYTFSTEVVSDTDKDCTQQRIGLRSLRLLREKDDNGREFCFELNGKRVFMKGANYIPCDNFLPRVSDSIYAQTISDAVNVNMNMLRVWGGGVYEDNRFYDLCDENGLLVWQDFMFACSLYPARGHLLESIREEVSDNIRRLRNHACLALWCGSNECQDAYYGWGWKEDMDKQGPEIAERTQREFQQLYYEVLPELVKSLCPDIAYTPSSPFAVEDASAQPENGDYHYWGVWHKNEPIKQYNLCRARFFSEYGMQSFPEFESVKTFAPDSSQWDIRSDVMMSHQRGGEFANGRIESYLEAEYGKPADFADLLYVGQLMQADAMKTAVEAHRRDKGYCWGTLVWQINDCWPVASWSTRDWYGRWKGAHYMMRHAMDDIVVSPIEKDGQLQVFVVNDRQETVVGSLCIRLVKMDGTVLSSTSKSIKVLPNSSMACINISRAKLLNGVDTRDVFVCVDFKADRTYSNYYCFEAFKDMHFQQADIKCEISVSPGGTKLLTLSSNTYVHGVFLSLPDAINPFSDNYFDIEPCRSVTIEVRTALSAEEIIGNLSIVHLGKTRE